MKAGVWILVAPRSPPALAQAPQERPDWKTCFLGSGGRWNDCHCGRAFWRMLAYDGTCTETVHAGIDFLQCLMPCLRSMPEVRDEFQVIRWDGGNGLDGWNQDQTLRSSMRHSTVWVYQRLPVRSVECAKRSI